MEVVLADKITRGLVCGAGDSRKMSRVAAVVVMAGVLLAGSLFAAETVTVGVVTGILPHHGNRFTVSMGPASYDCGALAGATVGDTVRIIQRNGDFVVELVQPGVGARLDRFIPLPPRKS